MSNTVKKGKLSHTSKDRAVSWYLPDTYKWRGLTYRFRNVFMLKRNALKEAKKWLEKGYDVHIVPQESGSGTLLLNWGVYTRKPQ